MKLLFNFCLILLENLLSILFHSSMWYLYIKCVKVVTNASNERSTVSHLGRGLRVRTLSLCAESVLFWERNSTSLPQFLTLCPNRIVLLTTRMWDLGGWIILYPFTRKEETLSLGILSKSHTVFYVLLCSCQ